MSQPTIAELLREYDRKMRKEHEQDSVDFSRWVDAAVRLQIKTCSDKRVSVLEFNPSNFIIRIPNSYIYNLPFAKIDTLLSQLGKKEGVTFTRDLTKSHPYTCDCGDGRKDGCERCQQWLKVESSLA